MAETIGLRCDTAGDFLDIGRNVGKFDPEAADPIGKLVDDQSFAVLRAWRDIILFGGNCDRGHHMAMGTLICPAWDVRRVTPILPFRW